MGIATRTAKRKIKKEINDGVDKVLGNDDDKKKAKGKGKNKGRRKGIL